MTATPQEKIPVDGDRYRAAVAAATDADREFATEVSGQLIGVVKLFGALKSRFQHLPEADNGTLPVLGKLGMGGPMRAVELSESLCADPSTISRQVAALVKAGQVERQADPDDGRASILVITEPGREVLAEHGRRRGQAMAPLIAGWSEEERAEFLRLLIDFNQNLKTNLEPLRTSVADLYRSGSDDRREA